MIEEVKEYCKNKNIKLLTIERLEGFYGQNFWMVLYLQLRSVGKNVEYLQSDEIEDLKKLLNSKDFAVSSTKDINGGYVLVLTFECESKK